MIPNKNEMIAAYEARHGKELQKKLSAATVAVCGLGGLGSNISIALSRAGIGKLILIDFDKVDISNLHRQQYKANQIGLPKTEALSCNLSEIAPYTVVETHCVKITEENAVDLLSGADIICEAFDNPQAKAMLANTVLEKLPGKFYVGASGMAGIGSTNEIKTRRLSKFFYLCGDGVSEVGKSEGLFAARVMACAAHQAHTVIRILAGQYDV